MTKIATHGISATHALRLLLAKLLAAWLKNRWLCWGMGPMVALLLGGPFSAAILEHLISKKWFKGKPIEYQKDDGLSRIDLVSKTQAIVPYRKQLQGALWSTLGLPAILNSIIYVWLLPRVIGSESRLIPDTKSFIGGLLSMYLISDFGLYWGHRVQHEIDWLWKHCHSIHHSLETPTPMSAMYIDMTDATLQVGVPLLAAACIVRPHPISFYVLVWAGTLEHVLNHCGLDDQILNLVSFRWLPLRGSISHHDYHHKFCGRQGIVRNLGEGLWLWDWMFGTLAKAKVRAQTVGS